MHVAEYLEWDVTELSPVSSILSQVFNVAIDGICDTSCQHLILYINKNNNNSLCSIMTLSVSTYKSFSD